MKFILVITISFKLKYFLHIYLCGLGLIRLRILHIILDLQGLYHLVSSKIFSFKSCLLKKFYDIF